MLVSEYDNRLRNASHHRWLRLSDDRSEISFREGGNGAVRRLSYAEYLHHCCAITTQLMLLAGLQPPRSLSVTPFARRFTACQKESL